MEPVTVYVDDMRKPARVGRISARWSHLFADTDGELLEFAVALGMDPSWLQYPGHPREHFDLVDYRRNEALRRGATPIRYGREVVALTRAKARGQIFDLHAWRAEHGTTSCALVPPGAGGQETTPDVGRRLGWLVRE